MNPPQTDWIVEPIVPEPIYTDRQEFLDFFYKAALNAARRLTQSTVMLGQRRMGKTEIFKRVVNRLFFEQDPAAPEAVVPVYFSFPAKQMSETRFAVDYLENFIRHYVGFYSRRPDMIVKMLAGETLLIAVEKARPLFPFTKTLDWMLEWLDSVVREDCVFPSRMAIEAPRRVAAIDDAAIAVFLDEFQNTRLPQYDFDIVGFMQEAVESPTCPHFVTGSAMSMLSREIIGRGALFGRFRGMDIKPMTGYWGAEMARKAAAYGGVEMPELMAPVVADRCGGNPFYIRAVVNQAALTLGAIPDEEAINRLLAVDLSSGFIWGELHDQVMRWIERAGRRRPHAMGVPEQMAKRQARRRGRAGTPAGAGPMDQRGHGPPGNPNVAVFPRRPDRRGRKKAREKGILWSDRKDLDALLEHLGPRPLPKLDDGGETASPGIAGPGK